MEFTGRYFIAAPQETVWAGLNDADVLKACIPGCETLEKPDPEHFTASAKLKIGPVSATFKGAIALTELDPPRRCVLKGEGQGGVAGFARGEAVVTLTPQAAGTSLAYTAKANVGGKLAQIGQRLIDGAAKQIADDFFARFATEVAALQAASVPPPCETALAPPASIPEKADTELVVREGLAPEIWVIGLIAVVVVLLVLFGVSL